MTNKPSSPVCYAADASDSYMGYADRDEILAALNELLEAERAGARVAAHSHRETSRATYDELMQDVGRDEAHWCAMLTQQIQLLGGQPSHQTGAFFAQAMAISDLVDRLVFLNRGQAWVVRKIERLLLRVRDDALHADLKEMADRHRTNIERTQAFLEEPPSPHT